MHIHEALVFIVTATTVYSAPNLQNIENTHNTESKLEDSSSSDGYLSNDAIAPSGRNNKESPDENGFGGYLFDETICKLIHNRILCGYDRNKVENIEDEAVVDIGNGCFIRNDRIECGYFAKEQSVYLRFKSVTEINDLNDTILSEASSTTKQEDIITIPEEATTTMSPTSLPVADTSGTTTGETIGLLRRSSPESDTGTEHVETSSTILSTTLIKPVSSNNPSETTIKEFNTTISSTTTNVENAKDMTDLENRSKVDDTNTPMFHKLKRSIEQTREEKASSKCLGCPLKVLETDTTTLSPAEINTPVMYSRRANMNMKYVRDGSDTASTKTACVEKDDRIVCYNYRAI